jgi:hypothetical protein
MYSCSCASSFRFVLLLLLLLVGCSLESSHLFLFSFACFGILLVLVGLTCRSHPRLMAGYEVEQIVFWTKTAPPEEAKRLFYAWSSGG